MEQYQKSACDIINIIDRLRNYCRVDIIQKEILELENYILKLDETELKDRRERIVVAQKQIHTRELLLPVAQAIRTLYF